MLPCFTAGAYPVRPLFNMILKCYRVGIGVPLR